MRRQGTAGAVEAVAAHPATVRGDGRRVSLRARREVAAHAVDDFARRARQVLRDVAATSIASCGARVVSEPHGVARDAGDALCAATATGEPSPLPLGVIARGDDEPRSLRARRLRVDFERALVARRSRAGVRGDGRITAGQLRAAPPARARRSPRSSERRSTALDSGAAPRGLPDARRQHGRSRCWQSGIGATAAPCFTATAVALGDGGRDAAADQAARSRDGRARRADYDAAGQDSARALATSSATCPSADAPGGGEAGRASPAVGGYRRRSPECGAGARSGAAVARAASCAREADARAPARAARRSAVDALSATVVAA